MVQQERDYRNHANYERLPTDAVEFGYAALEFGGSIRFARRLARMGSNRSLRGFVGSLGQ